MKLIINTISVFIAAYLIPNVEVENFVTALIVAVVLGLLNYLVKPLLIILTLPINILTLGLFTLVINVALIMFTSYLVEGFYVQTALAALIFGFAMSVINSVLNKISK